MRITQTTTTMLTTKAVLTQTTAKIPVLTTLEIIQVLTIPVFQKTADNLIFTP